MHVMTKKAKGVFTVLNDKGLHTRPSTEIVKCAAHFHSQIHLSYRDFVVNAKSILGILMMAAGCGSKIKVEAVGDDAEEALAALLALAKKRFHVAY
jgi:phosphocarrier protein HPr